MHRKSSTLGLEQPGSASAAPAPEPKKLLDAAALQTKLATMTEVVSMVSMKSPTPATTEVEEGEADAEQSVGRGTQGGRANPWYSHR